MRSSGLIFKLLLWLLLAGEAVAGPDANPPDMAGIWGPEQVSASRIMNPDYVAANAPRRDADPDADPTDIMLVVENAGRSITLLNGDTYAPLARFDTQFAVLAAPKFSPDGRFAYILSHSGWVEKYDLWSLQQMGRVRVGLGSFTEAMSTDGKWLAVVNNMPKTLSILATDDLKIAVVIATKTGDGAPSGISALHNNPLRQSFVIALSGAPKIWEVFYGAGAPETGFAHDWRIEGPVKQQTGFPIRKFTLASPLENFAFDASGEYILGAKSTGGAEVIDLVIGLPDAGLALSDRPNFSAHVIWKRNGTDVMAVPHQTQAIISVIDLKTWDIIARIPTKSPGLFIRTHKNSRYLWVGKFTGPDKDMVEIIDKQTLKTVKSWRPLPGATLVDVAFSKDGDRAMVLLRASNGAIMVYDARTLQEITRLPMRDALRIDSIYNAIN